MNNTITAETIAYCRHLIALAESDRGLFTAILNRDLDVDLEIKDLLVEMAHEELVRRLPW